MAIILPDTDIDFSKIFASNTPLNPYHWSDSNYQTGWNTVGSTPPTRAQFDALQNLTDRKFDFLKSCVTAFKEGIDGKGGIDERIKKTETQIEKQEVEVDIRPADVVYCVKLGKKFMMQYGWGITDANGVAIINFQIDFDEFTDGSGVYIPVPIVWANDVNSYCAGVGSGFYQGGSVPLRQKDKVYMFVSSGQTGLPAPNVDVGVFAFGLLPNTI